MGSCTHCGEEWEDGLGAPVLASCYWQAQSAMPDHPGAVYVEGWAVRAGTHEVFHHGWLREPGGQIFDASEHQHAAEYFEGMSFTHDECDTYPPGDLPLRDVVTDKDNERYDAARAESYDAAKAQANAAAAATG